MDAIGSLRDGIEERKSEYTCKKGLKQSALGKSVFLSVCTS